MISKRRAGPASGACMCPSTGSERRPAVRGALDREPPARTKGSAWPCRTEVSKGATAPLRNHLRDADEICSSEFAHSVERFDRDGDFGHTASVIARLQGISDDALVATDRRFNFRAPVVASRLLPVHPPVRIDARTCWSRWVGVVATVGPVTAPLHGGTMNLAFGFLARTPSRT